MDRIIAAYSLPTTGSFFNSNSLLMTKIGFFFSNGDVVTEEHKDPGSGFLVMLTGGVTRVAFTKDGSQSTLAATGDMVFIKNGVHHQVFSKGPRFLLLFYSYMELDYNLEQEATKSKQKSHLQVGNIVQMQYKRSKEICKI